MSAPLHAAPQVSLAAVNAADAAFNGKYQDAGALAEQSGDPVAVKLVEFIYLRNNWKEAGYSRIMAFLNAAPQWPLSETLLRRAEQSLYFGNASAQTVLNHFENRKPLSPEGTLALARAQLATGNADAARRSVRRVWLDETLDQAMESRISSEFGSLISGDDRKARMWRLVYKQETNAAIRASKLLSSDYQAAAKAAQALIRGGGGADKLYQSLSSAMKSSNLASAMRWPAITARPARRRRRRRSCSPFRPIMRSSATAKPGGSNAASSLACCSIPASPAPRRPPISSREHMVSDR